MLEGYVTGFTEEICLVAQILFFLDTELLFLSMVAFGTGMVVLLQPLQRHDTTSGRKNLPKMSKEISETLKR